MDYQTAEFVLQTAQDLLGKITQNLSQKCAGKNGEISIEKLDQHQIVAYDYTYMSSEVAVASAALTALKKQQAAQNDVILEEILTHIFIAETAHRLADACYKRLSDYGITSDLQAFQNPVIAAFMDEGQSTALYEKAADLIFQTRPVGAHYGLDEQHTMFRDTFKKFAETEVMALAEKTHRQDLLIPEELIQKLSEMGCFGLSLPESYGGFQNDAKPDNTGMVVVTEELSRGSLGVAGSLITRPEILSKALLKGGTEEQKQEWLPKLATGEKMVAVAVTEPDFGSDVAGMKVAAIPTPGGWLLNGCKTWCTFAGYADTLLVLARTDPDLNLKHKGLSILIAEKPRFSGHEFSHSQEDGGKISGRAIGTIGYRGMHSYEVFFDNYFVPEKNLIGGKDGLGKGFYLQMEGFAGGRLQTAGRALGVMQAAFEAAVKYALERKVFGKPIAHYQLTKYKVARMAMLIHVNRQFTYHVARLMDDHKGQLEASQVKLYASRMAEWVTREAMQIHGGMGYAEEFAVSRYFVDARVFSIFEGAEETLILRVVARSLLEKALKAKAA
jgi:(2S)-methylsuccinyl-CoA dehydrogenase